MSVVICEYTEPLHSQVATASGSFNVVLVLAFPLHHRYIRGAMNPQSRHPRRRLSSHHRRIHRYFRGIVGSYLRSNCQLDSCRSTVTNRHEK